MRVAVLLAVILSIVSCKGPGDLAPDEFRLDYTRGWADNNFDHRNVDFATDSDAVTVGFSWYLGETASERESKRQADQIERMTNLLAEAVLSKGERREPVAPPTTVIVNPPAPEPKPDVDTRPKAMPEPGRTVPSTPEPKPTQTDVTVKGFGGNAVEYLIYALAGLVLTIVAVLKRRFLVEHAVTIKRAAQRRFKMGGKPTDAKAKAPGPPPKSG